MKKFLKIKIGRDRKVKKQRWDEYNIVNHNDKIIIILGNKIVSYLHCSNICNYQFRQIHQINIPFANKSPFTVCNF